MASKSIKRRQTRIGSSKPLPSFFSKAGLLWRLQLEFEWSLYFSTPPQSRALSGRTAQNQHQTNREVVKRLQKVVELCMQKVVTFETPMSPALTASDCYIHQNIKGIAKKESSSWVTPCVAKGIIIMGNPLCSSRSPQICCRLSMSGRLGAKVGELLSMASHPPASPCFVFLTEGAVHPACKGCTPAGNEPRLHVLKGCFVTSRNYRPQRCKIKTRDVGLFRRTMITCLTTCV